MRYARHLVKGLGWFYVCFGLCFAIAPGFFLGMATGEALDTAAGTTEIRAVYGGMGIGVGIWMLLCLGGNVRLGLLGGALTSGGIVVFRVAGLLIDGNPTPHSLLFLSAELGIIVATVSGLRAIRSVCA